MSEALSPDQCIAAMFETCGDIERIATLSDQWWQITVTCPHGSSKGISRGITDISRAFQWALKGMSEAHKGDV